MVLKKATISMKKFLLPLLFSFSLYAHPHAFIDVYPTITFHHGVANTIHFRWKIDEMTSAMLMMDIDKNSDGKIDAKESAFAKKNYFDLFKEYDFYTSIEVDGDPIEMPQPQNFKASLEDSSLIYSFDIQGDFDKKHTVVEFGDSDYYMAFILKNEFITVAGAQADAIGVDNDFYYGYKMEFR